MADTSLTKTFEPNLALRTLFAQFFDRIQVDDEWVRKVRELSARGTVIYVLRNLNALDFFALDHLTKRYGLPQVRFVNDLGLGALNPMGRGIIASLLPRTRSESDHLRDAIEQGGSAALFLKRPPNALDIVAGASGGRGLKEGDELIRTLIDLSREREQPLLLVPQVFVWSKSPDTRGTKPIDFVLGPREWPGAIRTVGQFLLNYRHVALRVGEPLDLSEYLANQQAASDAVHVRRITYAMLRRVERERRSVTGPAAKPPDRVRHEILRSPRLRSTIEELAGVRTRDRAVLVSRALAILREMQATPDQTTVTGLEMLFERVFERIYAGIEIDEPGLERVREAAKEGALVLLPSHKSHIDYLVLSYVFNQVNLQLPIIAAGDNLNFFPVGAIFRRGGAFFIRRSFKGDRLYAAVVDAYVRRLIRDGYPIEVFLEGGRSRTGKLLPPKYGILGMIVDAALGVPGRQTRFVPISIGYERIVESYERELTGGEKQKEDATQVLKATEVLRHRYGRINLQFGQMLSLAQVAGEVGVALSDDPSDTDRRAITVRLGNRVMDEINRVSAVTPGALTAMALLIHDKRGISHEQLVDNCRRLLAVLQQLGARVTRSVATSSGAINPEAIREACEMFLRADMLEAYSAEEADNKRRRGRSSQRAGPGAIYSVPDAKRLVLDTTKNIIVHFFVERALVATALRVAPGPPLEVDTLRDRVRRLSRLFKFEFRFHADASFDQIFDRTLSEMQRFDKLRVEAGRVCTGDGADGWSGAEWLDVYAGILRSFLEGYRVAARGLSAIVRGPLPEKDLVKKALAAGNRMFLAHEIERREAVSQPVIRNAYLALEDQGYLERTDGKLALSESFRTVEAVRAIEGRIAGYLEPEGAEGDS